MAIRTLHILVAGTVLKVLMRLAFTPGGGSKVNTREARSRFTGTWVEYHTAIIAYLTVHNGYLFIMGSLAVLRLGKKCHHEK